MENIRYFINVVEKHCLDEVGRHYGRMGDHEHHPDEYQGRKIIWMGVSGRMVKMTAKNSEPMWGNIFDRQKISDTADAIVDSEEKPRFDAPLVHIAVADINLVKESIVYGNNGDLMYDPAIQGYHILTTGDNTLDEYLRDEDQFLDDNSYDDDERNSLKLEMEEMKRTAQEEKWGDIGTLRITVRDGNHRRAAAFEAGEPFVYGIVAKNGISDDEARKYLE